jgi:hypothetical protein
VVGIALRVERTYFGGQFASGEGVTLDWDWVLASTSFIKYSKTHIRRQNDGRRRKVQFRDVERLIEEVRWV